MIGFGQYFELIYSVLVKSLERETNDVRFL